MTCKDCVHGVICNVISSPNSQYEENAEKWCPNFKNKADFVEVVRCKDCKHWRTEHDGFCGASYALCEINNANNDYCSYGERKE